LEKDDLSEDVPGEQPAPSNSKGTVISLADKLKR
jgi:hypothetical protein